MEIKELKVGRPACDVSSELVSVKAFVDRDLSALLPYIKGALGNVKYYPKGPFVKFVFAGHTVVVDHDCVAIAGFADAAAAGQCAEELVELLRGLEARKETITPDATPFAPPPALEIFKLLPRKSGCARCGYPACMAFAVALLKEATAPERCPELSAAPGAETLARLRTMLGVKP